VTTTAPNPQIKAAKEYMKNRTPEKSSLSLIFSDKNEKYTYPIIRIIGITIQ
jgi:hypothetical protein